MLQMTDSTLGEVVKQLTTAITLAVSATNGTQNDANLQAILQQATGIRDQVLTLANTSYQGRYLFAGSQGTTRPYALDSSTTPATVVYSGDSTTQSIETPGGQQIQMNLPGTALFGSGSSGPLAALNKFIDDLSSGAGSTALAADSASLNDAPDAGFYTALALEWVAQHTERDKRLRRDPGGAAQGDANSLVAANPADIATELKTNQTQYQGFAWSHQFAEQYELVQLSEVIH